MGAALSAKRKGRSEVEQPVRGGLLLLAVVGLRGGG